jgi:predicted DNA-binding transcriptional regulator AlpA
MADEVRRAAPKRLLSVPEAAALAGLSKSVAYRLVALDRFPGLLRLPGCRLLVRRRVLEAWLAGAEPPEDGGLLGWPATP